MTKENFFSINLAVGAVLDFGGISGAGKGNTGDSGGCCDGGSGGGEYCDPILCCDSDYGSSHSSGCDSDCGSGGCDSDLSMVVPKTQWFTRTILTLQIVFLSILSLAAQATEKASQGLQFALYAGPELSIGPVFLTCGACMGQFGCFAVGGGINIGKNWGIGILIPIWIWW